MYVSPNRTHQNKKFFKYMPASTAEIVLANRTLRWSSPLIFNDPFDFPRSIAFDFSAKDIQQALSKNITAAIDNTHPITIQNPLLAPLIDLIKRSDPKIRKQVIYAPQTQDIDSQKAENSLDEVRLLWQEWLPNFRVLCLSEHHDKPSMWYHYADKYSGAVLEICCNDKLDSAWLSAKKIEYPKDKPSIYTADGWANLLIASNEDSVKKILHLCTYTKSHDWSYEDEWRISTFKKNNETGLFSDYPVHPSEFGNLYLGPMINTDSKNKLLDLAKKYPNMKVVETKIGFDRELKFSELSSNNDIPPHR